ncbi:hypothetical protein OS493_038708 [Desmophyllum pertusum]|uniref:Uncharacterized protein n=1 Tax=Desmophyllum pertusum TaxID=174260 RepID=A0A9W9ZHH6_9CNID|nr:hypothetical protein OS493_038708 [Desmophyllum pertusum]
MALGMRPGCSLNMAANVAESAESGSSQKRRGPYLQFLSDPSKKIPKSTFYEWNKKINVTETQVPGSENIDGDVESSETRNLTAEFSTDSEVRGSDEAESTVLSSDSESSSNEDDFVEVEDSDAFSACFFPNPDTDNPNIGEVIIPQEEDSEDDVLIDDLYDLDSEGEADLDNRESDHKESCLLAEEEGKHLYQGAPVTLGASLLLVMTFAVRHGLSGRVRCPVELHYYCTFCLHYIGREKGSHCPNTHCLKDLGMPKNSSYFIVIPLVTQLCSLLARSEIPQLLQYRVERRKKRKGNIEDVFDGKLYKKHFDDRGFFHGTPEDCMQDELHISLQVNTDGVAIFRSSSSPCGQFTSQSMNYHLLPGLAGKINFLLDFGLEP